MEKFEITKREDASFMFNLKASNGLIIMTSQDYITKEACQNGIESVKTNSVDKKMFKQKQLQMVVYILTCPQRIVKLLAQVKCTHQNKVETKELIQ